MFSNSLVILLVCISVVYTQRLPFPSYIKRCSVSAPDFDECCLKNGREAIPFLQKGDKKYGIPNMLPMQIPSISVEMGADFSLVVTNLQIYGLETVDLKRIKFDLENKKISGQVEIDAMELIGKYDVNGRILVIPIQGKGAINITTVGCTVDYSVDYVLVEKEGEQYFNITSGTSDISLKRAYLHLTNLFNGNEELGANTNKILNDEWEQVIDTLKPVLTTTIVDVVNSILNGVFTHIPYKEFFLD